MRTFIGERILEEHIVKKDTWKNFLDIGKKEIVSHLSVSNKVKCFGGLFLRRLSRILLVEIKDLRKLKLYGKSYNKKRSISRKIHSVQRINK